MERATYQHKYSRWNCNCLSSTPNLGDNAGCCSFVRRLADLRLSDYALYILHIAPWTPDRTPQTKGDKRALCLMRQDPKSPVLRARSRSHPVDAWCRHQYSLQKLKNTTSLRVFRNALQAIRGVIECNRMPCCLPDNLNGSCGKVISFPKPLTPKMMNFERALFKILLCTY